MTTDDRSAIIDRVNAANEKGMAAAVWAKLQPDKIAVYEASGDTRNYADLNANANRIVRLLREAGLRSGDSVALVCTNIIEFAEVVTGTLRSGMRLTPVNWHLTADEIAYVIQNCEAKALIADARVSAVAEAAANCPDLILKILIDGALPGFSPFERTLAEFSGTDIDDPNRGFTMLYTSGTTGRPKGVFKPNAPLHPYDPISEPHDVNICTGPGYHASPMLGDIRRPIINGVTTVLLDKWDSENVLRLIERYRITRGHFVPIMFQRLLALPDNVKAKFDVSSIRRISHGAAPCSPDVKRAMIEWWGPVLHEYYAGSEGGVGFRVDSHEWQIKPGTVGRLPSPGAAKILDADGNEVPRGQQGAIYMRLADQGGFEYFKDRAKTQAGQRDGYFTMGDNGYLDEDDYLFLTGRNAETIIAGGVNIYPQEIDNELIKHPAVEDSCTVGIPRDEWGEEVRAVIQLKLGYTPSEELRREILEFAAARVAKFKTPRGLDFVETLPRSAAGKIQRNKVREPYWAGRTRQI